MSISTGALRAQFLSQEWAVSRPMLERGIAEFAAWSPSPREIATLERHLAADRTGGSEAAPYVVDDGIALIGIGGLILKEVPLCFELFGGPATSTEETRYALETALADPRVSEIVFEIDSPGGEVSGVQELADAIHAAGRTKPTHALIRDCAASAAYWLAAQCTTVTANPTAAIGSIGVYMVCDDVSAAYDKAGIKTHVISSGGVKGGGVEGAPVAPEVLDHFQARVDGLCSLFVSAVARGRGMSEDAARALATGECWFAADALRLGLIDRVRT